MRLGEANEPGKTDWARLRGLTDEDIEAAIAADPDASLGPEGETAAVQGMIFQDGEGQWRWRLITPNGEAIADSPRGYADRAEVDRAIQILRAAMVESEKAA